MIDKIRIEHFPDRIIHELIHADVYYDSGFGEIRGSGSARSLERAIFIAFQEMRERYYFRKISRENKEGVRSSSGFASGLTAEDAVRRAEMELVERDAFMRHWLCKRPPHWQKTPDEIQKLFLKFGFEVRTAFLADYQTCQVGLMGFYPIDKTMQFGFGIATSAGVRWQEQIDSLLFNIARLANIPLRRMELNEALYRENTVLKTPADHYEYYFHPKNAATAQWFWQNSETPLSMSYPKMNSVASECELELDWKSYVAQAQSDQVVHIQFGQDVDFALLSRQLGINVLNQDPHPLG